MKLIGIDSPMIQEMLGRMESIEGRIGELITTQQSREWYNEKQLMEMFDLGKDKLREFRKRGLLRYHKTGRKYLYSSEVVEEFIQDHLQQDFAN